MSLAGTGLDKAPHVRAVAPTATGAWTRATLRAMLVEIRPYQWVKNSLIFIPAVGAHRIAELDVLWRGGCAFVAFSLCASAGYVLNDLIDAERDRQHPDKRRRPLASGDLSAAAAYSLIPLLLTGSFLFAKPLGWSFVGLLGLYMMATLVYSTGLKKLMLVDVFALAGLYSLRILAGESATGVPASEWLFVFSLFVFLSLALVKRYAELERTGVSTVQPLHGRDYLHSDKTFVLALGSAAGCVAALVLALYVQGGAVRELYTRPRALFLLCPLVFFWISRTWLLATRGAMHSDPILYAFRDRTSYLVGAAVAAVILLAR